MNLQYNKFGYCQKKKFLNNKEKFSLLYLLKKTVSKYTKIDPFSNFEDIKLHKNLLKFRKKYPKQFGEMYDSLNLNSLVRSIFYKKKFINLFSKLLNTNVNNIYISGFQFRLDPPRDKRNTLDWHQDASYFHVNYPKFNAGVCWISITNNTKKNGTVIYIPKTHASSLSKYKSVRKSIIGADQRKIKISPTEKKQTLNMNANFGDVSCFHIKLKHKSGFNKSKKIRMSVGCRFYDMNTSFNMGKERYIFNKSGKENLF